MQSIGAGEPTSLAVQQHDKEMARTVAMRDRMEARRDRFFNARNRTIGVDMDALSGQVAERRERDQAEAQEGADDHARQRYITMLLEQREAEEREAKRREMFDLKANWEEQAALPKGQPPKRGEPIKPHECGASALQNFAGEDHHAYDRSRLQRQQMRSWTTQQMAEKSANQDEERAEAARYAAYVKMLDARRGAMEAEEQAEAKQATKQQQLDNLFLAQQKAEAKHQDDLADRDAKALHVSNMMGDPLMCEDTGVAALGDGGVRREHFKGYSKAQIAQFYKENQQMLEEKAGAKEAEAAEEALWTSQTSHLNKMIEAHEAESAAQKRFEAMEHKAAILQQAEVEKARKKQAELDKYGSVQAGYFDGFGTSVR